MSPILTVCQEERRIIRGLRPAASAGQTADRIDAASVTSRKRFRFIGAGLSLSQVGFRFDDFAESDLNKDCSEAMGVYIYEGTIIVLKRATRSQL